MGRAGRRGVRRPDKDLPLPAQGRSLRNCRRSLRADDPGLSALTWFRRSAMFHGLTRNRTSLAGPRPRRGPRCMAVAAHPAGSALPGLRAASRGAGAWALPFSQSSCIGPLITCEHVIVTQ